MAKRTGEPIVSPLSGNANGGTGDSGGASANANDAAKPNGIGSGFESFDPSSVNVAGSGTTSDTGDAPKKRGRPFGSKNKTAGQSSDIDAIRDLLSTVHGIAAIRIPEMKLEDSEATLLATSIVRAFPNVRSVVSGETAARVMLGMVVLQVYGTRAVAIGARIKKEKAAKDAEQGGTVIYPPGFHGQPAE